MTLPVIILRIYRLRIDDACTLCKYTFLNSRKCRRILNQPNKKYANFNSSNVRYPPVISTGNNPAVCSNKK